MAQQITQLHKRGCRDLGILLLIYYEKLRQGYLGFYVKLVIS